MSDMSYADMMRYDLGISDEFLTSCETFAESVQLLRIFLKLSRFS